jgi:hypothetical protein
MKYGEFVLLQQCGNLQWHDTYFKILRQLVQILLGWIRHTDSYIQRYTLGHFLIIVHENMTKIIARYCCGNWIFTKDKAILKLQLIDNNDVLGQNNFILQF